MEMLVSGLVLLGLSVLLLVVVAWGSRKNSLSFVFSDGMVANLHTPLMLGMGTFGLAYLIKYALVAF